MDRSAAEAAARAAQTEGSSHLGDFLPPEELAKFMEQCKVRPLLAPACLVGN